MDRQPIVYLVDDCVQTRDAVRDLAQMLNLACASFITGQEFISAYDATRRGCVLLEVRTPGMSGLQVQRYLSTLGAITPVVFLAARATVSIAVQAMRNGAVHFLEKPIRDRDLWEIVHEAIELDDRRRHVQAKRKLLDATIGRLSQSQHELLQMIAAGKTNRQIAGDAGVCVRTIESRRSQLMETLKAGSLTELLRYALHVRGYGAGRKNDTGTQPVVHPVPSARFAQGMTQTTIEMIGTQDILSHGL